MLIDEIRNGDVDLRDASSPTGASLTDWLLGASGDAMIVRADNVSEYYFEQRRNDVKIWTPLDLPTPVPPSPSTWVEFAIPHWYQAEYECPHKVAMHCQHSRGKNGEHLVAFEVIAKYNFVPIAVRLVWGAYRLLSDGSFDVMKSANPASNSGSEEEGVFWVYSSPENPDPQFRKEFAEEALRIVVYPALLTFSFMHCKNVRRVENLPDEKLQKARERKGKDPLTKFYTLEINPMKEVLRKEGQVSKNGLARALHICRGHFAHYTEERPLFGKVSGRFWVPAHVRGSKDAGEVKKDYSVKVK